MTYVRNPTMDFATGQLTADHAYWLSAITLRDGSGAAPLGTVDVLSQGFGQGDPTPSGVTNGAGVLLGGQIPAMAYSCESQSWGPSAPLGTCEAQTAPGPTIPVRDELDIDATNVSDVTVNARRARVTCDAQQNITSDGPITVHMVDCPAVPTLSVSDETQAEGDSGSANMTFTVTLTGNTDNLPVSFHYGTDDGSATAGSDYGSVSGDVSFAPGETTKTIDVPITGDTVYEGDENFTLELSNVQFATPASPSGTGTITEDDPQPDGYARPKGATPNSLRLVPAFDECTSGNASHGAPFDVSSCSPPVQSSDYLTFGAPDVTGDGPAGGGGVILKTTGESPIDPNNGDQSDVVIDLSITDVRNSSDFSDYTGELRAVLDLRITDRNNGPDLATPATASDTPLGFNVSCLPTGASVGATCNVSTTADAVTGANVAMEGKRAVWGFGQVQVFDGGSDGDADTAADNTLFLVQGLFAP